MMDVTSDPDTRPFVYKQERINPDFTLARKGNNRQKSSRRDPSDCRVEFSR